MKKIYLLFLESPRRFARFSHVAFSVRSFIKPLTAIACLVLVLCFVPIRGNAAPYVSSVPLTNLGREYNLFYLGLYADVYYVDPLFGDTQSKAGLVSYLYVPGVYSGQSGTFEAQLNILPVSDIQSNLNISSITKIQLRYILFRSQMPEFELEWDLGTNSQPVDFVSLNSGYVIGQQLSMTTTSVADTTVAVLAQSVFSQGISLDGSGVSTSDTTILEDSLQPPDIPVIDDLFLSRQSLEVVGSFLGGFCSFLMIPLFSLCALSVFFGVFALIKHI